MEIPSFDDFQTQALRQGFDAVLTREWAPHALVDPHTHPFAVQALMVRGELWLTVNGVTQHLRAGDRFSLEPEVLHAERYGSEGATFWVARRIAS
ncbi:AraC family ligand binding domain-containing protein [Hydrogenophaga sp.]|uniref:cupin domain-containing protein n=1 Tax=Hydrogenophaga sp. TaxID=1904254 RepID=UPI0025C4C950|nr:AraC family ligand binding domain-containing protein [Hydrogenophaga sp.]